MSYQFNEIIDKICSEKQYEIEALYNNIANGVELFDTTPPISEYLGFIERAKSFLDVLKQVSFPLNYSKFLDKALLDIKVSSSKSEEGFQLKVNALEAKIAVRLTEVREAAKNFNKETAEQLKDKNELYDRAMSRKTELKKYEQEIITLCSKYGITTSDVDINNDTFSVGDIIKVYDDAISFMQNDRGGNVVKVFRDKVPNLYFQGGLLLLCLFVCFTQLFNYIALVILVFFISFQLRGKSSFKKYYVLLGLLYNVDPYSMAGYIKEVDESLLRKEDLTDDEIIDSDSSLQELVDSYSKVVESDDSNLEIEQNELLIAKITCQIPEIDKRVSGIVMEYHEKVKQLCLKLENRIQVLSSEFSEKQRSVSKLGDVISKTPVLDTNFTLGLKNGIELEKMDIGLSNVVIRPTKNKVALKRFLHVMLVNYFSNVVANSINVIVYDPNTMGQDVIEFYNSARPELLDIESDSLSRILEKLKGVAQQNMQIMLGVDINTYNKKCIEDGKIPRPYTLFLVLSQSKKMAEDEALREFMSYSATSGVLICVISTAAFENVKIFNTPFEGVSSPYPIEVPSFAKLFSKKLEEEIKLAKPKALSWSSLTNVAIPDSDDWVSLTDQFIEINPGFGNGDPQDYKPYTLGNEGDAHALLIGTSGAGKSQFLNQMVCSLSKKYAPDGLEFWLIDYKGNEFSSYMNIPSHPYMLPHIKACVCTSDGAYSASVFKALVTESDRRYEFLKTKGHRNVYTWNKECRASGHPEDCIPAILVVNDEFQVIFEIDDDAILSCIKADIKTLAKKARAANIHVLFASQSMNKTVEADVLDQFSLRFGLRCSEQTSVDVMGSNLSGLIRDKYGMLYVRSATQAGLKLFKTPGLPDGEMYDFIKKMSDKAEDIGFKRDVIITYNEEDSYTLSDLDNLYRKIDKSDSTLRSSLNNTIFLGERMTYSENRAPENLMLGCVANTHIFSVFSNQDDLVWFFNSYIQNVKNHTGDDILFYNSQVKDYAHICCFDELVDEKNAPLAYEETSIVELTKFLKQLYKMRKDANSKTRPMHIIILGIEKALGVGIEKDTDVYSPLCSLLEVCAEYNMHFIFIGLDARNIPARLIEACSYKIAGKTDQDSSYALMGSKIASLPIKLKNGYMCISKEENISKCKIYKSEIKRSIAKRELIL